MSFDDIFKTPQPLLLLFAWKQIDDDGLIRKKFENKAERDEAFVVFIGKRTLSIIFRWELQSNLKK
jgi:hypothetical protein